MEEGDRIEQTGGKAENRGKIGIVSRTTAKYIHYRTDDGEEIKCAKTSAVKVEPQHKNLKHIDPATIDAEEAQRTDSSVIPEPSVVTPSKQQEQQSSKAEPKRLFAFDDEERVPPAVDTSSPHLGTPDALVKVQDARAQFGTGAMLDTGAWMPEHVPLVCVSFASGDLASNDKDLDGHDGAAGHDPWSICDYIREDLHWLKDSIYIDKEQVGCYADRCRRTYTNGKERPWCKPGTFVLDAEVHEGNKPQRNFRGVYKWAQRVSQMEFVFLSSSYLKSSACKAEMDDLHELIKDRDSNVRAIAFICLEEMDQHLVAGLEDTFANCDNMHVKVFDLSAYADMLTCGCGSKWDLRHASAVINELKDFCLAVLGKGDADKWKAERDFHIRYQKSPHVQKLDIRGHPVRNPYLASVQRRINLNQLNTKHLATEIKRRLPNIGTERSQAIASYISNNHPIESVHELTAIRGIGDGILQQIAPFVTACLDF
eukprot:TRINITY_DN7341_c0_g1_i1.p1 TRINITY_DN7341_c0_g1~~TRINITY_DN7341_c0_g1_i1.p1  ORF type:complete len:510 (+),score=82.05 TRINITY_DN7341_c0_g1_i1:79-1530(+)